MASPKTVLVIGASRGLGLGLAGEWLSRGWQVIATTRGPSAGLQALAGDRLRVETLEMTDPAAVATLRRKLDGQVLDLLFVNAGISNGMEDQLDTVSTEDFTRIMLTNALAPLRVVEGLGDLVRPDGTIGVMSSSLGSLALNEQGGLETYRASKAALNMLMRSYAARAGGGRSLALVDPGWVRTDMGGANATLGIEDSIPGIVDALAAQAGKPGLRYVDYRGQTVPW